MILSKSSNLIFNPFSDSELSVLYADKVKFIEPGVYTLVEIQNGPGSNTGWGKLKSGIGWISLDYVIKM